MKKSIYYLLLTVLSVSVQFKASAQELETPKLSTEIQSFPLIDHQITFYDVQMDLKSIVVKYLDGKSGENPLPKLNYSMDMKTVTIDFNACAEGQYLITGTRGDIELAYAVENKK
jgi:hypothetical protein